MFLTVFGNSTDFKFLHSSYLQLIVFQMVLIKTVEK